MLRSTSQVEIAEVIRARALAAVHHAGHHECPMGFLRSCHAAHLRRNRSQYSYSCGRPKNIDDEYRKEPMVNQAVNKVLREIILQS
jgi:hypothetical protein